MDDAMVKALILSPAFLAVVQKFAVDFIKAQLKKIDTEHMAEHYSKYLQLALAVMSGLSAFILLALQGHAQEFDPKPLVEWAVTMWLASQGAHSAISNITKKK